MLLWKNAFLDVVEPANDCAFYVGGVQPLHGDNMGGFAAVDWCRGDEEEVFRGFAALPDGRKVVLGEGGHGGPRYYESEKDEEGDGVVVRKKRETAAEEAENKQPKDWDGYLVGEIEEDDEAEENSKVKWAEFVCNGPYCEYFKVCWHQRTSSALQHFILY